MRRGAALVLAAATILAGCARTPAAPEPADVAENNRGVGLMGQFDYREACTVFRKLVEAHPHWADVRVNLAIAVLNRQEEGDEAEALRILEGVLADDPDHLRARYCTGLLLYRAGDEGALAHLSRVAGADPDDAYAAYFHASALERAERPEEALAEYERALALDPYLRSAYYRASRILLRMGRSDEGLALQETFQELAENPRARTVDFVYTKMGPKAEARAVDARAPAPAPRPEGPLFAEKSVSLFGGPPPRIVTWPDFAGRLASITAADIDGDGDVDLFVPGQVRGPRGLHNAVLLAQEDGTFTIDLEHPLATVAAVSAALWGDYDNDGRTDVYFCRRAFNQLWRSAGDGTWEDVTESTGTAAGRFDTVDGAFADLDHDGDLDIFCVNADGPNELLNNNRDGTFRPLAAEQGLEGPGPGRQVLVTDLDADRDADLVVLNHPPPHEVYLNDRLWTYRPADGFDAFRETDFVSVAAGDVDADGRVELFTCGRDGTLSRWAPDTGGTWTASPFGAPALEIFGHRHTHLALLDADGDATPELITNERDALLVVGLDDGAVRQRLAVPAPVVVAWAPVVLDPEAGPALVAQAMAEAPVLWPPGPGRFPFAAVRPTGRDDPGQSMRSNASGIGAKVTARMDSRWSVHEGFHSESPPGQSLQPLAIGLGGAARIDFVEIDWPDGVFQTELDLAAGELHAIPETQRQMSSCPVLFAWDGTRFRFVSDLLGVGGLGYLLEPGTYAPPRPRESFLLPEGLPRSRDGRYALRLGEPMEEACYLDAAGLAAYDLPPGWSVVLDERMATGDPPPTGEPRFYRRELTPVQAVTSRGEIVTETVLDADLRAAPLGALDRRFLGRLRRDSALTLVFDAPLDGGPGEAVLVADGWVEYPYSQTMFAAWQAGAGYRPPTIEAAAPDGPWRVVRERFGYPAGMPRRMSVPLGELPAGTTRLRITTNQEIYWDRLAVAFVEPAPPELRVHRLRLETAEVARCGFPRRTTGPQRLPHYDYDDRAPFWDTRRQRGRYTAFGPARELVARADGASAIFGPGEEVRLEYGAAPDLPEGWTRRFVLEARGWCKDMDLFTRDGETLAPIPGARDAEAQALHERYNTRYAD